MNLQDVRFSTLPSGLRVVTHQVDCGQTVDIDVKGLVGSRDEVDGDFPRGTLHGTEHVAGYGARRHRRYLRPNILALGYPDIPSEFDLRTGFASLDCLAKVPLQQTETALDIIGETLSDPDIQAKFVARERKPIMPECGANEHDFGSLYKIWATYFGYGQHARLYPVIGGATGIRGLTPEVMQSAYDRHFRAGRFVVAVEGNIRHDDVVRAVEKSFVLQPGQRAESEKPAYTGGDRRWAINPIGIDPVNSTYVTVGFKSPVAGDFRAAAAAALVRSMLSAPSEVGRYSIFGALRIASNLVYSTFVSSSVGEDSGIITVSYEVMPENLRDTLVKVRDVLASIAEVVDPTALEQAQGVERTENKRLRGLKTVTAASLASDIFQYGKPVEAYHNSDLILSITDEEVRQAARAMLDHPPTFLAAGNIDPLLLPSADEVRNIFASHRAQGYRRVLVAA